MPESFRLPPPPLTSPQRTLVLAAALTVAATRVFAVATSPWDWDEVQFMAGVHEYDVGMHHPHPAGFPLYILLGKLVHLFGASDFRSLQAVTFLAACAIFPIVFFLARELRFGFRASILAALLFAFFPNIWYFGGTIFSDVTGVAINLAAVLMLMRGCRDGRAFLIGCALVGCALAVRPHGGFILLPPLLVATWHQRLAWKRVVAGAVIVAGIATASYTVAALSSHGYVASVTYFQKWVHDVDSYVNPRRTPLRELAVDFLVWPMGAGRLSMIVTALAVLALVIGRRHPGVWVTFATFAPYMIFAWLMHDPVGARRYATAYVALYALLAAFVLDRLIGRWSVLVLALIIGRYVMWTWPALREVRTTIAPTHAAATLAQNVVPPGGRVWVDDSMMPWASYYLAGRKVLPVDTPAQLPLDAREYFLTEGMLNEDGATVFARGRGRVAEIHPQRHFEASVAPVPVIWRFGDGWSDAEGNAASTWRWMAGRGVALIPGVPGKARLRLVLGPPKEITPDVEVRVNGLTIDRFHLGGRIEKLWVVDARAVNQLEILTSATINPRKTGRGTDDRDLGLRLFAYGWRPQS